MVMKCIYQFSNFKCKCDYGFCVCMKIVDGCKILLCCCVKGCKVLSV